MARAVNSDGQPGLEVASNAVTVSSEDGVCLPQMTGAQGAEPFSAKLKYTGKCRVSGIPITTQVTICTHLRLVAAAKILGMYCVCMYMHTYGYTHHKNNTCSTYTPHVCFKSQVNRCSRCVMGSTLSTLTSHLFISSRPP